ncbi:hypothetical protein C8Q80DRAFT_1193788 [Daedaleopsis nitida]|nr:hypothetical protein C8Q80DRAFT_1193788 [Daedaleopsis nitida]
MQSTLVFVHILFPSVPCCCPAVLHPSMATTFGLCEVCFQSTFGMCCVTCSNLLRCISGPEPRTNEEKPSTSREDDASSIASSSSSDSYTPMEVDFDYEDEYEDDYDEEYDEEYEDLEEDTDIMILAQDRYSNGVTPETAPPPPISFGPMLSVQRALTASAADMDGGTQGVIFPGHDEPAFPSEVKLSQKMSVRILVKGHQPYEHQTNILHGKAKRPTRGQLAMILGREVQRFTDRELQHRRTLRYDDRDIDPTRLLLLGVHHVSKSSLQPILGVSHST